MPPEPTPEPTAAPEPVETPRERRKTRWMRGIAWLVAALLALIFAAGLFIDSDIGHRLIAQQIAALKPANGMRYSVGRIRGSIFSRMTLVDVRVSDPKGLVAQVPIAELDWVPLAWLANRLEIRAVVAPVVRLEKMPQPKPTGRKGPILPSFDIHVGSLRIDRLIVGKSVTGTPRSGRVVGRADVRRGRALIDLRARVEGSDRLRLWLDSEPDRDRFDVDVHARGRPDGVLAKLTGIAQPLTLDVTGKGHWSKWTGHAVAAAGGKTFVDLALGNQSGRYSVNGAVTPSIIAAGKIARLGKPQVQVNAAATFADRRIEGEIGLRTPELALTTTGEVDLGQNRYNNVRILARLLQPPGLFPNMTGRNVELRMILDGPMATAGFDYRLTADHIAFDQTGFDRPRAAGKGHLSHLPITVPLTLTVPNVTGVGDVAGGILRNFEMNGALKVDAHTVRGDAMRFRSDKLSGALDLTLDLKTGRYDVGLTGALTRYLIPGLGIVDVTSRLSVVPTADGKGTHIAGTGTAQVVRLDNEFFRTLAGGLPRLTTALERGADGILHFNNLVLTGPAIRVTGSGYRRHDGSFVFNGRGTQTTYGPFTLMLDGMIDRPRVEVALDRPNDTLGLRDVKVRLDPMPSGFDYTASGGSMLGGFHGNGQILLPKGANGSIVISALDVGGIKASGTLHIVTGGFDGVIDLKQGGVTGTLAFAPVNGIQKIEAHLAAQRATLANDIRLRRGQVDVTMLLDPAGASIDGNFQLRGLRRGSLSLSRMIGLVKLKAGSGQIMANFSGARGRAFDLRTVTDVTPDSFRIALSGTIDRRDVKLVDPAMITRNGDGWQLAPTRLLFADGQADLSGRFTSRSAAVDVNMTRLPLSLLDIGYPDLGLSGVASGKLSFAQGEGQAPTGRADLTIRGLSRSGLVMTSQPIDVGMAGVLTPSAAAVRAVMASQGKTIGRAQARIAPLGEGTLVARLANAPLFAQVRYNGPADTLWRLTGIEFFDLSGPVAIGADVSGKLNDPRIRGAMKANGARIESPVTGTVLTNVQATGQFNGSKLVIGSFNADAGKNGKVSGSGSFEFAAVNGFGMDLSLRAENAVIINRDDIAATVTGPVQIRSDGAGGLISGNVTLNRGRYQLGQAAAATAVPQLNIREINLPGGDDEDEAPAKPWRLDVAAKAADGLTVTGLGLSSEWSTNIRIQGEPTNPQITGRADLVRGTYEFAGREFQLERGAIRFGGEVPVNPALDIQANVDETNLSATIRVTGQALKPLISFTSNPALPEDELLSRLLFGTSITNLSAPEALQLASAVAALQNSGGGLNPINAVRRAVGLDRLRILPADPTQGRSTSVAAGKYVTRRFYAEIITDGQGYSATQVEFQVTRWLSLLSTVSTLGRTSANVKVSKDY